MLFRRIFSDTAACRFRAWPSPALLFTRLADTSLLRGGAIAVRSLVVSGTGTPEGAMRSTFLSAVRPFMRPLDRLTVAQGLGVLAVFGFGRTMASLHAGLLRPFDAHNTCML